MPLQASPGAVQFFQDVFRNCPELLRELLELWTIVLEDPQTPMAERQRINSLVATIELALREVLESAQARMRVLEEEGYGRGGPARVRGAREGSVGGRQRR
ncbi:hypothetical protein B9Z19DRAFT_1122966 [Tuber borchii]|uniref:Uncharacterized protein n=1 Tax=Tuber borchii TaxID=42251 RepID=A0A2T6ZZA8_TUBBO|nr:hypothetical protein B9Z19DRAFT_1122966 [Tuber borchii]